MNSYSLQTYKKFRKLLYTNTALTIFNVVYTIIVFAILLNLPFPQRTRIEFMDQQMINEGEAAFIILATTWVFTALPIYFAIIVTSGIVIYKYFYIHIYGIYGIIWNNKWWNKVLIFLYCLLYLLFPLLFVWLFYIDPYKLINWKLVNSYSMYSKPKGYWLSFSIVSSIATTSILPMFVISILVPDTSKTPNRVNDLKQTYALSQNKPNTMILYFDRAYGLVFNQLLMTDYLMFHNSKTSFIDMFPEFTSYLNSLSQSMVTNTSNPTINGSWFFQPEFKNNDIINPFNETNFINQTYDNFYLDSYKVSLGMLASRGYQNFSILNPPYYGVKSYHLNADAIKFQNNINNSIKNDNFFPSDYQGIKNNKLNITSLDVTEIAKSYGLKVHANKQDEINFLHHFAASTNDKSKTNGNQGNNQNLRIDGNDDYVNLSVDPNKESTFIQLYFQTTHEDYQFVKNNQFVSKNNLGGINYENVDDGKAIYTDPTPNNLVISNWYAIQKLKRIFIYLKNLPCNDNQRLWVRNQYDNTNIYIVSDHGTPIVNSKNLYVDVINYLIKNNVMTQTQSNYILNKLFNNPQMSWGFWNTIFIRKPAKYKNNKFNIINKTTNDFFNKDDLFVASDLFPIIESDILKQNYDIQNNLDNFVFKNQMSFYYNKKTRSIYEPLSTNKFSKELINKDFLPNFILDPLNNEKIKIGNREIPLYRTNWVYAPNLKKFKIYGKYYFKNKYKGGVFNINNFFF